MKVCLIMLIATGLASQAYIYPFEEVSSEIEGLSQKELAELITYNVGLQVRSEEKGFEKMITTFGKGSVLSPIEMNYVIVVQSDNLFEAQEVKQSRITDGFAASVGVHDRKEKSLIDLLFADEENSLVHRAEKLYKNLPFVVYQNEDDLDINLLEWTVTLYLGPNQEVFFYEPKRDKAYRMEDSLEKCVDFFFGTTFDYAPSDDKIKKYNTDDLINITPDNKDLFLSFFKDICAMNKLSQIFKKGDEPNLLTIINKSVSKLEKVLNEKEIDLVYDMMRIAHKKLSKNLKNYFEADSLFGMILIEQEKEVKLTTQKESAKVQRILMETRTRMLDQTATAQTTTTMTASTYQIYVWFGVGFTILLLGVLYQFLTMEITKDTLLYAKFLTTDQRN